MRARKARLLEAAELLVALAPHEPLIRAIVRTGGLAELPEYSADVAQVRVGANGRSGSARCSTCMPDRMRGRVRDAAHAHAHLGEPRQVHRHREGDAEHVAAAARAGAALAVLSLFRLLSPPRPADPRPRGPMDGAHRLTFLLPPTMQLRVAQGRHQPCLHGVTLFVRGTLVSIEGPSREQTFDQVKRFFRARRTSRRRNGAALQNTTAGSSSSTAT
jgi:hypothetical protein